MLNVRPAAAGDKEAWDGFARSHSGATPYHLFAWKEAVEQAYGHTPSYLIAEQDGEVAGVLPLIRMRIPVLMNQFVSLPFCDMGSILAVDQQAGQALLERALQLAEKSGGHELLLRGPLSGELAAAHNIIRENTDKVRMLLELPASSEILMKQFKSKLRSQVRKAEKNNLVFSWGDVDSLAGFYAVFSRNMRDLGSPVHSQKWLRAVLECYGADARLGLVASDGVVVGGGIILSVGNKISIPWASTLREYNRLAPNMLLYWNLLAYGADHGYQVFDFGRSSKGEGTYRFKAQWGARPEQLDWYSVSLQPANRTGKKRGAGRGRELAGKIWQKMPLAMANTIGPCLRKYINL